MQSVDTDMLLSRIVEGQSVDAAWGELKRRAAETPELWHDLAESYRDAQALGALMGRTSAVAAAVDALPGIEPGHGLRRLRSFSWSGWAVAALVVLAWLVGMLPQPMDDGTLAGLGPSSALTVNTAAEARDAWIELGRQDSTLVGEMPDKVLLESREHPDGGFEVVYVTQFVERGRVSELFEYGGTTGGANQSTGSGGSASFAGYRPGRM